MKKMLVIHAVTLSLIMSMFVSGCVGTGIPTGNGRVAYFRPAQFVRYVARGYGGVRSCNTGFGGWGGSPYQQFWGPRISTCGHPYYLIGDPGIPGVTTYHYNHIPDRIQVGAFNQGWGGGFCPQQSFVPFH